MDGETRQPDGAEPASYRLATAGRWDWRIHDPSDRTRHKQCIGHCRSRDHGRNRGAGRAGGRAVRARRRARRIGNHAAPWGRVVRRVQLLAPEVRPFGCGEPVIRHLQCTHAGDVIMDHVLGSDPDAGRVVDPRRVDGSHGQTGQKFRAADANPGGLVNGIRPNIRWRNVNPRGFTIGDELKVSLEAPPPAVPTGLNVAPGNEKLNLP